LTRPRNKIEGIEAGGWDCCFEIVVKRFFNTETKLVQKIKKLKNTQSFFLRCEAALG
jgi:hypothetical protein